MKWGGPMGQAEAFFTSVEKEQINRAVAEAEKHTAGEIVPVIAVSSGRYERAADALGLLFGLAALIAVWLSYQRIVPVEGDWAQGQRLTLGLHWIVLILIAGFLVGSLVLGRVESLRYLLATRQAMQEEVERRAQEAFARFRVGKTADGTGIVLYLSLFERMVSVQGDATVSQKLDQKTWEELKDIVIGGIREGRAADGLCRAITRCGEIMSQHFPVQPGDVNELPNELRVLQADSL